MRSTYLDWRDDFWRLAEARRWRVFYLGGAPGVADDAPRRGWRPLPERARSPPTTATSISARTSAENRAVLAEIAAFDPHVLMVGMGMPLQEIWALENRAALERGAILTVGAAFDYEAGVADRRAALDRTAGRRVAGAADRPAAAAGRPLSGRALVADRPGAGRRRRRPHPPRRRTLAPR